MEGEKRASLCYSPARPSGSSVKINMYEDVRMMTVVV